MPIPDDWIDEILDPNDDCPVKTRALRAWLNLHASLALDPVLARECLDGCAEPERALRRSGVAPRLTKRQQEESRQRIAREGFRVLPWPCRQYPERLRALSDPPPVLLVKGESAVFAKPCVGIVGARAATTHGLEVARNLGRTLARAGVVVVSGLARGIDAAAHRGVLEEAGATIAVQACGPEQVYPASHRKLAEEIVERGLLLTEFPVGTRPLRPYFPLRNRLISGLSDLVVIVEARCKSGSLITARHALDQGRDVMALPGPINAPTSWGPNRLIRDGAPPLLGADDVLDWLGVEALRRAPRLDREAGRGTGAAPSRRGQMLLDMLQVEPLGRDALTRRLAWDPSELAMELLDLELAGWLHKSRDGRLVASPRR